LEFYGVQFVLLLAIFFFGCVIETGMGSPRGSIPRSGTGMGKTQAPTALAGTGTGKFCRHGDGDGKTSPDGEFPVAIPIAQLASDFFHPVGYSLRGEGFK